MKTQLIDQMVFDAELAGQTLQDWLRELDEVPETWINTPAFPKSLDEMTKEEAEKAIQELRDYLIQNY